MIPILSIMLIHCHPRPCPYFIESTFWKEWQPSIVTNPKNLLSPPLHHCKAFQHFCWMSYSLETFPKLPFIILLFPRSFQFLLSMFSQFSLKHYFLSGRKHSLGFQHLPRDWRMNDEIAIVLFWEQSRHLASQGSPLTAFPGTSLEHWQRGTLFHRWL